MSLSDKWKRRVVGTRPDSRGYNHEHLQTKPHEVATPTDGRATHGLRRMASWGEDKT